VHQVAEDDARTRNIATFKQQMVWDINWRFEDVWLER